MNKRLALSQPETDFAALAAKLHEVGAVVVQLPDTTPEELWLRVNRARSEFIEYIPEETCRVDAQHVLGGFGAFGNPSSFHHPDVRFLRGIVKYRVAMPLFNEYTPGMRVEAMFDRLCVRARAFGKPSAESWHRDVYDPQKYVTKSDTPLRSLQKDDLIFGGWLNCNATDGADRTQYFSFVPCTHRDQYNNGGGFAPELDTSTYPQRKVRLPVPPGHVVIFAQGLVHEVVSGVQPTIPSIRLFAGHRVTHDEQPLFPELAQWITNQAVPRIPSGQRPPMFSTRHYMIRNMLAEWSSKMFRPEFLNKKTPDRFMRSLHEYGQDMLPPYSSEERLVLWPEKF